MFLSKENVGFFCLVYLFLISCIYSWWLYRRYTHHNTECTPILRDSWSILEFAGDSVPCGEKSSCMFFATCIPDFITMQKKVFLRFSFSVCCDAANLVSWTQRQYRHNRRIIAYLDALQGSDASAWCSKCQSLPRVHPCHHSNPVSPMSMHKIQWSSHTPSTS